MNIVRNLQVPTGNILIVKGDKQEKGAKTKYLEAISLGDYGRDLNVKADFLGLTRDIKGVPNGKIMPLTEKWVATISTQYGCSMGCLFCDVPKVGKGINANIQDLINQVQACLSIHPEIATTKRLNVHFARMGEPTFNNNVLRFTNENLRECIFPYVGRSLVHPVISTMLPKSNKNLMEFLNVWTIDIKNHMFRGDAGLQFSINSTSDEQREEMFNGNSLSLKEISEIGKSLIDPRGRKYTLNFALADEYEVDAEKLVKLFNPKKFIVKITPLHKTNSCDENNIKTSLGYSEFTPYSKVEKDLKDVGFDVIVFIPSYDEDLGRITCGNAILSGSLPEVAYTELPTT